VGSDVGDIVGRLDGDLALDFAVGLRVVYAVGLLEVDFEGIVVGMYDFGLAEGEDDVDLKVGIGVDFTVGLVEVIGFDDGAFVVGL